MTEQADATTTYNTEALTARWSAVPNDEIGGWAVTTNGLGPLDGGRMAADLVMTREVAQHIADVHNQWLTRQNMGVPVATGFITTPRPQKAASWRRLLGRCEHCGARLCPVWGAGMEGSASPAVSVLHRWGRGRGKP